MIVMTKKMFVAAYASLLLCAVSCTRPVGVVNQSQSSSAGSPSEAQSKPSAAAEPSLISAEGTDAAEPALVAGRDGTAFVAWVEHRGKEADVWFAHLGGDGQRRGQPVRVNAKAGEATAWHGDPPTLAVAPDGTIYIVWTARAAEKGHANTLYLSASRDGGQSFAAPVKVNDDEKPCAHGMHSLAVASDGRVYVAWLDERNVAPPPPAPPNSGHAQKESNSEVFFAASSDGGRTFSANRRIASEVCPCCKTSLAVGADGRVYASWRQVLPGEFRHIAVASSTDGGETFSQPVVVSDDKWQIAGCPVSGAALFAATDGALHVLWYTAGEAGTPGLYRTESRDGGRTFAPREALARSSGRGTPVLLAGERLAAVWEERGEGGASDIAMAQLAEGNQRRATQGVVLARAGELPVASMTGEQMFVAYVSEKEGRRGVWLVRAKPSA